LKTITLPYLCDCSTDFDEIWQDDAHWPLATDKPLKFLKIEDGGDRHLENNKNRDISATV